MSTLDPTPNAETLSQEKIALVREHLKDVMASPAFAGSKRAQDFLQLVVEHALEGRLDHLRERMIGAEMFGRPIGYDTANDAVVRVKATEVRKKLTLYYTVDAKPSPVRIELPAGSYVPRFHWTCAQQSVASEPAAFAIPASTLPQTPTEPRSSPTQANARSPLFWGSIAAGVIVLAAISYVVFRVWPKHAAPHAEVHTIAVLPLENLSADSTQEYLADGLTEELIADLGQVASLRVISRTSVMTYKATKKTLPEIARELGVDAVVEGSILHEGNEIRVTAQLIDARTDQHLWARSYVRDLTSVLALQAEVAQAIANEVSANVTPQEEARLTRPRPVGKEAQEAYLIGLHFLIASDPRSAITYMQQSVDKDPNYAPSHAGLALSYGWVGEAGWLAYDQAFPRQKAEALKAIAIDESLPEGHLALATAVMNLNWDWLTCEREIKRTLELNPSSAATHAAYGLYLMRVGRTDEAMEELKQTRKLDPVSSTLWIDQGFAAYFARHYDDALSQFQRAAAIEPNPAVFSFPLGVIYVEKKMYPEAVAEFQKLGDQPHALGHMGNAYARMGRTEDARVMVSRLEEHVRKEGVGRFEIALIYAGLGETDQAFVWLEKSYAAHDKGLTYLRIDPCLDPLRSDPRFQNLIHRVGFPA